MSEFYANYVVKIPVKGEKPYYVRDFKLKGFKLVFNPDKATVFSNHADAHTCGCRVRYYFKGWRKELTDFEVCQEKQK